MNKEPSDKKPQSDNHQPTQKIGRGMYSIAWLFAIALMTVFFSDFEEKKINPNQNPSSSNNNGVTEVVLHQNRQGHYVTTGTINNVEVTFLLDTGATDVSIPEHIAQKIGLQSGRAVPIATANGTIKVYQSWINELTIGDILLRDVDANINPSFQDDFILLGMSALKKVEFTQRDDKLTLRTYK